MSAWDPTPLARALIRNPAAPPTLVLAAARHLFLGDSSELTRLAYLAATKETESSSSDVSGRC